MIIDKITVGGQGYGNKVAIIDLAQKKVIDEIKSHKGSITVI